MPSCIALNPAAGSAETMVNAVDCYIQSTVQAGYANLLGQGSIFSVALTIALTIYVAIIGYRLIFGRSTLNMSEMMPRMVMIGAVLALTSNWSTYQVLVYDVLTDGPQEIVRAINPNDGDVRGITERVDVLSGLPHGPAGGCVGDRLSCECSGSGGSAEGEHPARSSAVGHLRAEARAGFPACEACLRKAADRIRPHLFDRQADRLFQVPLGPDRTGARRQALPCLRRWAAHGLQTHQR